MMQNEPTSSGRITVTIDPDLADIIPLFLANRQKDIHTLESCRVEQDLETIRLLGHRMKGDGGGYGFQMISQIGGALECAAERRDYPSITHLITELKSFLARVNVVFR
jgi:HPt (histidine-containing phosphotransfer) domain-containing protein